jgi:tetratricopeptide (TPR) repeat protein
MNRDETTKVLPFGRSRRFPDPARVAEFGATARRLVQEKVDSADVVTRVLRETPRDRWMTLAHRPEFLTSGALDTLAKVAAELERDPQESLAATALATTIAEALSSESYPEVVVAQHRGQAWKDRARAFCYVARYDEAIAALDRADASLEGHGTLAHDRAINDFIRSIVLSHLRRFDEAQAVLESCRAVFNDHGDVHLYRKCTVAAGNLLVRRGDYRAAREVLRELLQDGDAEATARARFALGWCAIHLGLPGEALEHFTDAARRQQGLASQLEVVRATYGAGCALLRLGRLDDAIDQLAFARAHFLEHAFVEEAGLSGLEIVEARMLRDEFDAARTLAATIVREFTEGALNRRAVAALAYLNDAIAASNATPEIVRSVHAYITELQVDPTREFVLVN